MVSYIRKRRSSSAVASGRVAKKPRMTTRRVASIAKKAVMKASETKKHSHENIEVTLNTNSGYHYDSLVELPSSTGQNGRIAHKVNPIGIDIRGHIITQSQSFATIAKVMVVRLKDYTASASLQNNLLETNAGNVTIASNDVSKMYRRINTDSYEVLASKYINLQVPANNVSATRMFKMWVPLKKLRTLTYEGAALTAPRENDIAIVVYAADSGNDGGVLYELSYVSTFYFKDP